MMKKILALAFAMLLIIATVSNAAAKVVTTYDSWTLEKYNLDKEWMISSCSSTDTEIEVISEYAGIKVTYIDSFAFMNNTTTERLNIPFGILGMGKYACVGCTALSEVVLPTSMTILDEGVFSETAALSSINLENTQISVVYPYTFMNSGIEEISFPTSCSTIKDNAFLQCENLKAAYIPSNVGIIGSDAFKGCDNLVIYTTYGSYASEYAKAKGISYVYTDLTEVSYVRGDADGDGIVNIMDATRIQRKLALYDDPYRIGEIETAYVTTDGRIITLSE